jgi:hypothetical protein
MRKYERQIPNQIKILHMLIAAPLLTERLVFIAQHPVDDAVANQRIFNVGH